MSLGAAPNLAVETGLAPHTPPAIGALGAIAEERISVATQRQLMWWRFRKHRLAMLATVVVGVFYVGVALAGFLAYADPEVSEAQRGLTGPHPR